MKEEFYVTLPSNVSSGDGKNLVTNYKTVLKKRLNFPANEDWRVGMAEFHGTKSWFNVRRDNRIRFIGEDSMLFEYSGQPIINDRGDLTPKEEINIIKAGHYNTVQELIDRINFKLSFYSKGISNPKLYFDENTKTVTVAAGIYDTKLKYFPVFSPEIENILGLIDSEDLSIVAKILLCNFPAGNEESGGISCSEETKLITKSFSQGYYVGQRKVDINAGLSSIYVYTNIVEYSLVGNAYAQLLRTIPVSEATKWGDPIHYIFDKPHLIPLQSLNFDTIEIDIRDDTGKKIPFEIGRSVVKLLFKKYEQLTTRV